MTNSPETPELRGEEYTKRTDGELKMKMKRKKKRS